MLFQLNSLINSIITFGAGEIFCCNILRCTSRNINNAISIWIDLVNYSRVYCFCVILWLLCSCFKFPNPGSKSRKWNMRMNREIYLRMVKIRCKFAHRDPRETFSIWYLVFGVRYLQRFCNIQTLEFPFDLCQIANIRDIVIDHATWDIDGNWMRLKQKREYIFE